MGWFRIWVDDSDLISLDLRLTKFEWAIMGWTGAYAGLMDSITIAVLRIAKGFSPVLTGTLRESHYAEVLSPLWGLIDIQPAVNPLTGGITTVYGPWVHVKQPWMLWTKEAAAPLIAQMLESAAFANNLTSAFN